MSRRAVWVLGAVAAAGATVGLAALSRAPLAAYPSDTPVLRLAWSVRPERIEHCRTLTDEELAGVPAHMRQRVQCEGRSAGYRLVVSIDGAPRFDTLVTGGGARGDRPVYVFRELDVPKEEAVPPVMTLDTDIEPAPREVLLVTYDIDRRALVLRTRAPVR